MHCVGRDTGNARDNKHLTALMVCPSIETAGSADSVVFLSADISAPDAKRRRLFPKVGSRIRFISSIFRCWSIQFFTLTGYNTSSPFTFDGELVLARDATELDSPSSPIVLPSIFRRILYM